MLTLAVFGIAVLCNSWLNLTETLALQKREPLHLFDACRTYVAIGKDRRFLLPALCVAAVFFFLFAYIGGATLVYQKIYHLSAPSFGILFGVTGFAILFGAIAAGRLVSTLGLNRLTWMHGNGRYCNRGGHHDVIRVVWDCDRDGIGTLRLGHRRVHVNITRHVFPGALAGFDRCPSGSYSTVHFFKRHADFRIGFGRGVIAWTGLLALSALLVCLLTWISLPMKRDATFSLADN